jgi:DNA modification methylase
MKSFRDPAFTENRTVPLHRWVPWIAGFSAQFVDDAIRAFVPAKRTRRSLVLDPFAGVGTTLLQAVQLGHDAVGYEINPYAALAAQTKLAALKLDPAELDGVIARLKTACATPNRTHLRQAPSGFRSRIPFFSKAVEPQILQLLGIIEGIPNGPIRDVARIALGSVMVSVSNYTYEPSLSSRPGAGKALIEDADAGTVLISKMEEMKRDLALLQPRTAESSWGHGEVRCASFLSTNGDLATGSVDLVITSPPYLNNYHYVRNSRPQLFWLSLVTQTKELRELEEASFGKFWQTVRDADPIPLQCKHEELARILTTLRQTRAEKRAYGGPGWANYVASYFNDCDRFLEVLQRVLHRGGVAIVVLGNSIIQGIPFSTDRILADLAEQKKLKLEKIIHLRGKRVGASITASSVRRGDQTDTKLYENAIVLQKR